MNPKVTFSVNLPYKIKKEGNVYVSWCPVLDVKSMGDTPEESRDMLVEALQLFLISCYERKTLEKVLKDCGFVQAASQKAPATKQVSVPLPSALNPLLAQCLA